MAFDPKPGDVIRYDFLWKKQHERGQIHGSKDRPCAVVLLLEPCDDGSRLLVLAPITHSPSVSDQGSIEVPAAVSENLGLDQDRQWIKTHEVNTLTWKVGRAPDGVTPVKQGQWTYGRLPQKLSEKVVAGVLEQSRLQRVERDE